MKRIGIACLVLVLAAACGTGMDSNSGRDTVGPDMSGSFDAPIPADAEAYPVLVSSEVVTGENRFLIGVFNNEDAPIGSPEIDVAADFFLLAESDSDPAASADFRFIETIPNERGLYVGTVAFSEPGEWGAEVAISGDGIDESHRVSFDVLEEPATPALGSRPPAVDTPTNKDVEDLAEITTDPHPDRDFYELSITDALKRPDPFVVVFATPKFCTSAVCGPTLDIVKSVAPRFDDINFLHVEVYTNLDDPSNLKPVPAVLKWGLPTEPWVFVVDERGKVAAKYEGTVSAPELTRELKSL